MCLLNSLEVLINNKKWRKNNVRNKNKGNLLINIDNG
jgi:hypothetical protein